MPRQPLMIQEDNLSRAWVRIFSLLADPGIDVIAPLVLILHMDRHGNVQLAPSVGRILDATLAPFHIPSIATTASTIFPNFRSPSSSRHDLYQRYQTVLPRLRRMRRNRYGTYFERMIAYGPTDGQRNQLEYIVSTYGGGNRRRSAFQVAIFDPARDHTNQRRRDFPCLQQISFSPDSNQGLTITGYYATQYVVDRAYGNFLGLCRLGKFMAQELSLPFVQMTCIAARARLGDRWSKTWARHQLQPFGEALAGDGISPTWQPGAQDDNP